MADITTLDSKVVYQNKWMTVREDTIQRASGAKGIYGIVDKPDFAVILPIDGTRIHLVQQYRYSFGQRFWEAPQGAWEERPDIDPEELALAELRQETGLLAGKLHYVGKQHLAYGFCSQSYHIFVASDFGHGDKQLDVEEEDLISQWFDLSEFERMIIDGDILDASTVNAYGLAKLKGVL
ncbi:MAG TPA: NUDIX hydrolase [Pseudomonadales bacterium]|nr:NUDIX hydrolase [Pseudomonadales bacterium]